MADFIIIRATYTEFYEDELMREEKDEIGFHTLLNAEINYRRVPIEKLGYGLFSNTMMYYIKEGDRVPDYLMRNRIMDRLGVSSENYWDYVTGEEYESYMSRTRLIKAVEEKRTEDAKKILFSMMETVDKEKKIEYQFLLDMKARILLQEKSSIRAVSDAYMDALEVTMPKVDTDRFSDYCFSSEEYYLLLQRTWFAYKLSGGRLWEAVTADYFRRNPLPDCAA